MVQRYSKLLYAPNKLESKLLYFTFFKNNLANLVGFLGICRIESDENKRIHIIDNKILDPRRLKGKEVDYITHRINAMVAFSRADRIEDCNRLASDLIDFLENGPGSYVDKDTRVALFYILDNTSNRESINDFHRLCALLLKP